MTKSLRRWFAKLEIHSCSKPKTKAVKYRHIKQHLTALVAVGVILLANISALAAELSGTVQGAKQPIAGSTVTLLAAGTDAPQQLAQGKSDDSGAFALSYADAPADSVLYVVAKGGTPKGATGEGATDAIALMTLLGTPLPNTVVVNELTTVASTFTAARFIEGESISGNLLGLRIAAGNVPNLVDPETGTWGKVRLVKPTRRIYLQDTCCSCERQATSSPSYANLSILCVQLKL
jgi:hypothetical protein